MKPLRYGAAGAEKPGLLDVDGRIRDLSSQIKEIDVAELSPDALAKLSQIDPAALPLVQDNTRLGVPVANVGKFIAIGLNFVDHAAESNQPIPKEPIVFAKMASSLIGPNDEVMLPQESVKSDWEVELGIVIGSRTSYVSEHEDQLERGGTGTRARAATPSVRSVPGW